MKATEKQIEIAIDFADWIAKNYFINTVDGSWIRIHPKEDFNSKRYSTTELFKKFNTKNTKP